MKHVIRRHKIVVALLVVAVLILATAYSPENEEEPGFLGQALMFVTSPVQQAVVAVVRGIESVWYGYFNLVDARELADELSEQVEFYKQELAEQVVAEEENARLRRLLGFNRRHQLPTLPARIIATDILGQFRTVTIDRGSNDGVRAGNPVVNADGVVGTVMTVFYSNSRVLLMIDPNSAIDGRVRRSGAQGIVQGGNMSDKLWCQFAFSLKSEDIQIGDDIVTSGLDQQFPPGLLLGSVVGLTQEAVGVFQNATVRPAADFTRLREVLIVTSRSSGP
jgi:rod shape-determining protein MreC